MDANIISAEVGSIDAVTGNKSAIANAGPMPGNTPTKVPRNVPSSPYIKLVSVRAVANPSIKRLKLLINYFYFPVRSAKIPAGKLIFKPCVKPK